MKFRILILSLLCAALASRAQLTMPANGGSTKATVAEMIGITDVAINYGRPALHGREGKIWGQLVHEGFMDDASFGKPIKMPWRAGANENTTISFSTDVSIEGKQLKAGKYGFHVAYYPDSCILIFSNNTESWGSYFYDEKDDALRVTVRQVPQNNVTERLTYVFSDQTDSSATISLLWEKLAIPFVVSTELQKLQVASIEREMNSTKSFDPQTFLAAANYYQERNIHLDKALQYAQSAARIFNNFNTAYLQSNILRKLNRTKEADSVINIALNKASAQELNRYGRLLLNEKFYDKAFEVFKSNHAKHPDEYVTNVGMMRGYSALGNYKKALQFADKARAKAPDERNKQAIEKMIVVLKQGKDINS